MPNVFDNAGANVFDSGGNNVFDDGLGANVFDGQEPGVSIAILVNLTVVRSLIQALVKSVVGS